MTLELAKSLLSFIAPDVIIKNFELVSIHESSDCFTLSFEEFPSLTPSELRGCDVKQDGFRNKIELHTFPQKGKSCYLQIRRRKWTDKLTGNTFSNHYDFHKDGMKTTNELGEFLKKIIEVSPINFSVIGHILQIDSTKIRRWYRDVLSGFLESGQSELHEHDIEFFDKLSGEIKNIFVPVCVLENIGEDMCIDEKQIGENFFTIISNRKTGKLAFMADTTRNLELIEASIPIKKQLEDVKIINRDLANCYRSFSNQAMPNAKQVGDKFHVVKLLLDAQQAIRIEQKRKIDTDKRKAHKAFKENEKARKASCQKAGKKYKRQKFVYKEKVLANSETQSEILRRSRFLLYQFPEQWSSKQKNRAMVLFSEFPDLEKAYNLSIKFRNWYSKKNIGTHKLILEKDLYQWYEDVEKLGLADLMNFSSTVERNEEYVMNYFFTNGASNAMAENRNGKIKKFINSNQGTRDRDFFFFRLKKYFA
ncbi:MAG: transposase [Desulfobacterales bacterium]|nr:transposase [Desulfobacterales bacterium]